MESVTNDSITPFDISCSTKYCSLIRFLKSKTVESAQPGHHSIVTRPFPSSEGGVWA